MRKITRRSTLAALGGGIAGGLAMPWVRPSWAQSGSVNVYNWSDYIGETTIADFEAETGISVVYDLYSSSEEMEAKMMAGMTGYDVVLVAGQSMPRFLTAGLLAELDRTKIAGWENMNPRLMQILEGWDPGIKHSVPYMWGSVGFTYNMDLLNQILPGADINDAALIFDPANAEKLAACGLSILDSPTDIMPIAARYLGLEGDTVDPADYDKVVELFQGIRPFIRTFDNANYLNAIPNGELCAINTWSGDYAVAASRAAEAGIEMNLAYGVPKTGVPLWFDVWTMPADAPNAENAYAFLNYMMRPEVVAAATNFTWYANANDAASAFVDPAVLEDPAVYPSAEIIDRMWAPAPLSNDLERAMTRAWQTIKTG